MALFRSSKPPAAPDQSEAYDLATPEEIGRRKRRRYLLIFTPLALVLLAGVWLGARPAYRGIKGWQARRIAAEAQKFIDANQYGEAMHKVQDALALKQDDDFVRRTAAVFLTRTGHNREAIGFWQQLEKNHLLSPDENRNYILALTGAGELDAATARMRLLTPEGIEGTPADWRVQLQIALRKHETEQAVALARRLVYAVATEQQRIDAALVLVASGGPADQLTGWEAIERVARGNQSPESLEALLLLARQAAELAQNARAGTPTPKPVMSPLDVADRIEKHPLAKTQQKLLVYDLHLAINPDRHGELVKAAIERFAHGDNETLAALCAWLYAQREPGKVLEILSLDRARTARALYLQRLDSLATLGRWQEVKDTIQGQKFTLEPIVEEMYLARCDGQLNQPQGRDLHWNAAIRAAGTTLEKLMTVGRYAQQNGAMAPAEAAFVAAVKTAPDSRLAYEGLLGVYQAEGKTADLRRALANMQKLWPEDLSIRNDVLYLDALKGVDLEKTRVAAQELMRTEPASLPHRVTVALAELRLGHSVTALTAFDQVPLNAIGTQPRFVAVYAAALWEAGSNNDARAAVKGLPGERLLPEERDLIREITEAKSGG